MRYTTTEEVISLHNFLIEHYGGLAWMKNEWQLDSVLEHIQNEKFYPLLVDKITHMFFGIIMFHCFNDGNKRTAITSVWYFLENNNYKIEDFGAKMEDIAVGVAQGVISKDDLKKIFTSILLSFWYNLN